MIFRKMLYEKGLFDISHESDINYNEIIRNQWP